jgi:hypothetical protein
MSGRPIGVMLLSCLAFLTSAISGVAAFHVIYQILLFLRHSPQSRTEDVQPLAYGLVPLLWIGVITLAGIAFTAGRDLPEASDSFDDSAIAARHLIRAGVE